MPKDGAPTWSWANTNFEVDPSHFRDHWKCHERRDVAIIEKLDVHALGSGQLKHARLTLRSTVLNATLIELRAQSTYKLTCKSPVGHQSFSDQALVYVYLDDPNPRVPYEEEIVCMPLYTCQCDTHGKNLRKDALVPFLEALILRRDESDPSLCVRLWVMWMRDRGYDFFKASETRDKQSLVIN
ncbi:hypothetical protein K458DRAFT_79040 [Lentithecium fluviatile CBS 122367]|uniref:Uncharacterized protein n=1 Tax=Lentithecium fluviatile CBS 122367 TaxID=1168545 RepID=A0A6G1IUC6_9PLEO|nr:hypothetical protein K458DRAFT_79040 [Lentithecium fluviatile CBS 122367]